MFTIIGLVIVFAAVLGGFGMGGGPLPHCEALTVPLARRLSIYGSFPIGRQRKLASGAD